ncbi:MAG: sterol desaturase family protein [Cytophagales bacterium]|nr:sterol desaturase family protein [Cytophagales bacterium]
MNKLQTLLFLAILLSFVGVEYLLGRAQKFNASKGDNTIDLLGFALLAVLTQPLIIWMVKWLGLTFAPEYQNGLIDLPWYAMFALFLVLDDMVQYWWHRASHSPLLWPLHRAHHSAHYMSARMIYRNNFFYYLFMPAIWMSAILIYLGGANVYLVFITIKIAVITGAHSAWRWDEALYKIPALKPVMWVLQRTISTPTTHWAHHAMTNADGIGNYKGNFGNLLFFWDILFGSAHITQQYPAKVGLQDDVLFGKEKWWIELFYPLFQSKRQHSAMVPGGRPYES